MRLSWENGNALSVTLADADCQARTGDAGMIAMLNIAR